MIPEANRAPESEPGGKSRFLFDLGFHQGEGLAWLTEEYGVDSMWTVFAFEPNSKCRPHLKRAQLLPRCGVIAMPFAVADGAGRAVFQRELEGGTGQETGEGSHLAEIDFAGDFSGAGREEVWKVDFPALLRALIPPGREGAFVVVKMDIEGAEYGILRAMLADGSIDLVDVLHVEFHDRLMESESVESSAALRDALRERVKLVEHW